MFRFKSTFKFLMCYSSVFIIVAFTLLIVINFTVSGYIDRKQGEMVGCVHCQNTRARVYWT